MPHKSFRIESKSDYGVTVSENYQLNNEQLQTGALLRIADATEKMAQNYVQLHNELKWANEKNQRNKASIEKLQRQVNAYKGIVKKLKGK